MQISKNKVALLSYTLKLDSGDIADEATTEQPLGYIHGIGNLLPAFESHLDGLTKGDKFSFVLSPEDGYGLYYEDQVANFPKQMFIDAQFPEDMLYVGGYVPMQDQNGNPLDGEITEINEDSVVVDFNHPLAGQNLHFSGEVIEVRDASNEELSHGHVHGAGGHHH